GADDESSPGSGPRRSPSRPKSVACRARVSNCPLQWRGRARALPPFRCPPPLSLFVWRYNPAPPSPPPPPPAPPPAPPPPRPPPLTIRIALRIARRRDALERVVQLRDVARDVRGIGLRLARYGNWCRASSR